MSRKKDKKVFRSQQEIAFERIQQRRLDEEIEARESREKLLSRGQLGQTSLLAGAPAQRQPSKQVRRRAQPAAGTADAGTSKALGPGRQPGQLIGRGI